jgi:hypothetical protein
MKKMFKLFMCAAVIAAGFTACSEEVIPIPEPPIEGEAQTGLLTINFMDSAPVTRASGDEDINSTDAERKVRDVTILVFNTQGKCVVDTTIVLANLTPNTVGSTNSYKAANINVPLGNHNVYAGINLTTTMKTELGGKGTFDGVSKFVWFGTDASTPTVDGIKVLCKADEFPMFSSDVVQPIKIEPQPEGTTTAVNTVTVPLDRMVAKVSVRKGAAFSGNNLKAAGATFSDAAKWALGNLNGKIYPYGKANYGKANYGQDPNYDHTGKLSDPAGKAYCAANFVNDFMTSTNPGVTAWTGFTMAVDENATAVLSRKVQYAPENNSKQKRLGESTFVAIQVKFAPDKVYTYAVTDPAPKEISPYTPSLTGEVTYYVVEAAGSVYYFNANADATAYATAVSSSVKTYYKQYCFYHLLLGKGTTDRNQYYLLTLNSITGLGTPTGEIGDEDVDNTADDKALLDVTLTVNEWVVDETLHDLDK